MDWLLVVGFVIVLIIVRIMAAIGIICMIFGLLGLLLNVLIAIDLFPGQTFWLDALMLFGAGVLLFGISLLPSFFPGADKKPGMTKAELDRVLARRRRRGKGPPD